MLPHRYQLWGWLVQALVQLLGVWSEAPLILMWGILILWLLILALSAWRLWREKPQFVFTRTFLPLQQSGQPFTVQLNIGSKMARRLQLHLFDHYPQAAASDVFPILVDIAPAEQVDVVYPLTIHARGRFSFGPLQLRYSDRFQLWQRDCRLYDDSNALRVYPRFDYTRGERFTSIATPQSGIVHPLHSRSGNGDFSHLRDYLTGDALNRIDHKASARLNKWFVREYDFEHEQPVMLMLDASRRLQMQRQGKTLFDDVLVAATQLARTIQANGDSVGLQVFADTPIRYLPCRRHGGQYRRFVESLFDCHASDQPPDYTAALYDIYRRQRQRALIILMTALESGDELTLPPLLRLLQQRHHVMLINIRPPYLDAPHPVVNLTSALSNAARDIYAEAFSRMEARLRREKLIFLSTTPADLRPQMINAYLDYKKRLSR